MEKRNVRPHPRPDPIRICTLARCPGDPCAGVRSALVRWWDDGWQLRVPEELVCRRFLSFPLHRFGHPQPGLTTQWLRPHCSIVRPNSESETALSPCHASGPLTVNTQTPCRLHVLCLDFQHVLPIPTFPAPILTSVPSDSLPWPLSESLSFPPESDTWWYSFSSECWLSLSVFPHVFLLPLWNTYSPPRLTQGSGASWTVLWKEIRSRRQIPVNLRGLLRPSLEPSDLHSGSWVMALWTHSPRGGAGVGGERGYTAQSTPSLTKVILQGANANSPFSLETPTSEWPLSPGLSPELSFHSRWSGLTERYSLLLCKPQLYCK